MDALRDNAKKNHNDRVAKTPERIEYAKRQFIRFGIDHSLKNEETGHFHTKRKSDGKLFQFYAGTGKIQGFEDKRGIKALLSLIRR